MIGYNSTAGSFPIQIDDMMVSSDGNRFSTLVKFVLHMSPSQCTNASASDDASALGFIVFLVGLKWAWTDLTNGPDRRVCCCLLGTKSEKNATLRCRKRKCWIELCGLNLHHIRPMCPARLRANSAVWCGIQIETLLHLDWLLLLARRNRFHFFFWLCYREKSVCESNLQ